MAAGRNGSAPRVEEELWLQIFLLSREIRDFKASLCDNTFDYILCKIEELEREINGLLALLRDDCDKKSF